MEEPNPEHEFRLATREEVVQFEQLLESYQRSRTQMALDTIPLPTAWDQLHQRGDGGRLFAALLDLWLTFVLLQLFLLAS